MGRAVDFVVLGVVLATSFSSLPIAYLLNKTNLAKDSRIVFAAGALCLAAAILAPAYVLRRRYRNVDFIIYVFAMFCWSAILDLFVGLELDGFVKFFIPFDYLEGEPYLNTTHGTMMCYWDGTAHFVLQLSGIVLFCMQESYREVGLYWSGSFINSMLVLISGALLGKGPVKGATFLNVPYFCFPVISAFKLIRDRPLQARSYMRIPPITRRPVDLLFLVYFILASILAIFRGFTVLGANISCMKQYLEMFEPYLNDPSSFPKAQMLVYQFYFLFYYLCAIHGLLYPGQLFMSDWSIIHAGASAQSQFVHIASSLHRRTPKALRAPRAGVPGAAFWGINLALLIVPHLFALRCWRDPENCGRTYTTDIARPVTQPATRQSVYRTPSKRD
ncbi:hypothetical protein BaRGS_00012751 [Batillaria attramentaria]|uniref:EXPERA domain-containing protein n=1 Tax=Batillaria attramentaria TaxID=370345 RepID=A0ABD0L9Q4_9CAEN